MKKKRSKANKRRGYVASANEEEAQEKVSACQAGSSNLNLLLRKAISADDFLTAKAALENGADPNSQNLLREGPMVAASKNGSIEMLRLLLQHGASLGPDKFGVPPLMHAVMNGREDLVIEMAKQGANINGTENKTLATPLHKAVGWPDGGRMVKLLLELGADPRRVNAGGENALAVAKSWQELFGDLSPKVFRLLEAGMKKWRGKRLPPRPRRRPASALERMADRYVDTEDGEANV